MAAAARSTSDVQRAAVALAECVAAVLLLCQDENQELRTKLTQAEETISALQHDVEGYWSLEKKLDQEQKSAAAMRLALEHSVRTRMLPGTAHEGPCGNTEHGNDDDGGMGEARLALEQAVAAADAFTQKRVEVVAEERNVGDVVSANTAAVVSVPAGALLTRGSPLKSALDRASRIAGETLAAAREGTRVRDPGGL